jgi:flagellar biosynthetic protein FliQ
MYDAIVLTVIRQALETLMWIVGPMLLAAIVVGVLISIIQNLTSIQDQTFSFVPRVVAIFVVFLIIFPWAMRILTTFTKALFSDFSQFIR